jgi:PKD repeat protein
MSNGWGGVDPASFVDASDYELGTHYLAVNDVTITHVRVFGGTGSTFPGRVGRIWSAAGSVLASVSLPSTITPGWNTYALTAPLVITAGTDFWVTYSTVDAYGFLGSITYPVNSADGNLRALGAGFHNTPTNFPDTPVTTGFFGIDVAYTPGASGNARPTAGLAVDVTGPLQVQANVTITDESPATCSALVEWGDGTSSIRTGPGSVTHTYAAAGTYAVMVTVTDGGGLTDSAAVPVTVTAAPGAMRPNAEQVAVRWLQGVNGITAGMVATTLPRDNSTWAASGFVRVDSIVGGEVDAETGYRSAVASITLWAANSGSGRPPWWKAARLGELIAADCEPPARGHRLLTIGTGYRNARVMSAAPRNDPRRLPGDPGSYAKYQMDLSLSWAIV